MPVLPCLRPAALLGLLAASACSYDLNERPTAGAGAAGADRPDATAAPLREVRWELRELAGQPAPATAETPFLTLRDGRPRAEGRAGCNRFSGPYTLSAAGELRLGPLVSTRSVCPDLPTEGTFLQALNQARRYRIRGNTLSLYATDTLAAPLAQLQAVAE
ncbi:META domain-containing protein [Hymenobacter algoricola]|uniref:DUF306 domain-containing protein n=1 Tax=Hymenobacter algoricola TaxID=486267 RepID=A0ABP7MM59_9BACT